jgi:hypothetical protein
MRDGTRDPICGGDAVEQVQIGLGAQEVHPRVAERA